MNALSDAWTALEQAAAQDGAARIVDHFGREPDRLARLSLNAAGVSLDLSKQSWSLAGFDAALNLARAAGVDAAKQRLFGGEIVNPTEQRPALHMALRARADAGRLRQPCLCRQSLFATLPAGPRHLAASRCSAADAGP